MRTFSLFYLFGWMRLFSCVFLETELSFQTAAKLGFFVYFLHVVLILKLGEGSESVI